MDISPIDLINIQRFASRVIGLVKYRAELGEYLTQKMTNVAPNLTSLIGEQVCTCVVLYFQAMFMSLSWVNDLIPGFNTF